MDDKTVSAVMSYLGRKGEGRAEAVTSEEPTKEAVYLLMAYSFLRAMPKDGLEETYQSLKDIFEFYTGR
jgi:hypothetical protein